MMITFIFLDFKLNGALFFLNTNLVQGKSVYQQFLTRSLISSKKCAVVYYGYGAVSQQQNVEVIFTNMNILYSMSYVYFKFHSVTNIYNFRKLKHQLSLTIIIFHYICHIWQSRQTNKDSNMFDFCLISYPHILSANLNALSDDKYVTFPICLTLEDKNAYIGPLLQYLEPFRDMLLLSNTDY